jgi:SAM-dependent methyltransferase
LRPLAENQKYQNWRQQGGEESLFGAHPDARVLALAQTIPAPHSAPVLDIGAGSGRNAIPLARRGHPVDAIEITPRFLQQLQSVAAAQSLPLRVFAGDMFALENSLPADHYQLVVLAEVVSDFREPAQLQKLMHLATRVLRPGGLMVFNMFLADEEFEPDELVRQLSVLAWACLFTRRELRAALVNATVDGAADSQLAIVADDSVVEFEKAHLPPEAWPPTSWFESWTSGRSIFPLAHGRPPAEMRWIVVEKQPRSRGT